MKSESQKGRVVIVPLGGVYTSDTDFIVRQIGKKSYIVDESQVQVDISSSNTELFVTGAPTDQVGDIRDRAVIETPQYLYHSPIFHTVYAFTPSEKGLIVTPTRREPGNSSL